MIRSNVLPSRLFLVSASLLAAATLARGQQSWSWPEKSKNLQVLPKDFGPDRLSAVMRGFTRSLGVRCTYCHVGQEGKPLGTYDFVSDQNPNKDRAREMYRMLGSITVHLKKVKPSGDKPVNMWCGTCHQGRPRPTTLEEQLAEAYRSAGIQGALVRYRELRERYHGRGGYDFGERALNDFGSELVQLGNRDAAIEVFHLNATQFPQSGSVWDSLAEAYLAAGRKELAVIYYRKSLEVNPQNSGALEKLRELEGKPQP